MQPQPQTPEQRTRRTRTMLLIAAAVLVTLLACGQCWLDVGAAMQIGKIDNCVFPPHSCQQP